MTVSDDLNARAAALQHKLRDVYGITGRDLGQSLRRARRVLPRHLRKAGAEISAAQAMAGHPKLERMIDLPRVTAIDAQLRAHLDAVDVADLRRGRWLTLAGRVAGYVLIVTVAFVIWMVWAGHL